MTLPRPRLRRVRTVTLLAVGTVLVLLAIAAVLGARALLAAPVVAAFVERYPGEYPLPEVTREGIPAWVSWTHFLNAFFLVLIIRTGIRIRTEKVAGGLWSSRRVKRRRMSLAIWGHLLVDVLWLANGVVFVVLLFATGHWARIVPTSPDVVPHALSALLQYAALDWPTHDGWANYNALQQLSYFAVTFIAAPIAALTGVRLSAFWPRQNARLCALFPDRIARALHFPTMVFFIGFVVVHVGLVLSTGVLRNLSHMYAAREDAGWAGLGIFALSLVALVLGGVFLTRDRVIAVIARRFGDVRLRPPSPPSP